MPLRAIGNESAATRDSMHADGMTGAVLGMRDASDRHEGTSDRKRGATDRKEGCQHTEMTLQQSEVPPPFLRAPLLTDQKGLDP